METESQGDVVADLAMSDQVLTYAVVMGGETAHIGSRVKHMGQRYTRYATATVTGFVDRGLGSPVLLLVEHDRPGNAYDRPGEWLANRVELAPDGNERAGA